MSQEQELRRHMFLTLFRRYLVYALRAHVLRTRTSICITLYEDRDAIDIIPCAHHAIDIIPYAHHFHQKYAKNWIVLKNNTLCVFCRASV